MNYPDWAPSELIELHKIRLEKPCEIFDPEQHIEKIKQDEKFKDLPDESFDSLKRSFYRNWFCELPENEGTELLYKVLTDLRMKSVWSSLNKRTSKHNNNKHRYFWDACQRGITGWRGDLQLTAKARQEYFQNIHEQAMGLISMMSDSYEFDHYSITELISKETVKWYLEAVNANPDVQAPNLAKDIKLSDLEEYEDLTDYEIDYAKFYLSDIVPSLNTVLADIASKASEYAKHKPLVMKPNSQNADTHYFIRVLSSHLQKEYSQPLHSVVATTGSVIFEKEISIDSVRKSVRQ